MKFFYADSLDLVDPAFNFQTEMSPPGRQPQRDDVYAHELFIEDRPYDGILVSKWLIDGHGEQGRYSASQRQRFLREGAAAFLRFPKTGKPDAVRYPIIGDCGAFNYHKEDVPPFSVDEVIDFYEMCKFTHGVSVDHMILDYDASYDNSLLPTPPEFKRRADLTLTLAAEFFQKTRSLRFQPLGVAQGWSPKSYREAVRELLKIGYDYIAVGGLVPLKTYELRQVLAALHEETQGKVKLHLLGITRLECYDDFQKAGVVSVDSTSPLIQGVKEGIYYTDGPAYTTVRIPQTDLYPKLLNAIRKGDISQEEAQRRERTCLDSVAAYGRNEVTIEVVISELKGYENLYKGKSNWREIERVLKDRPWEKCPCTVCRTIGIQAIVFRGANRNRRRGFHNLWFTHRQLNRLRADTNESVK